MWLWTCLVRFRDDGRALGERGIMARRFTEAEARVIAADIGLDLNMAAFDVTQFLRGLEVELEHGTCDPRTDVTDDDPVMTGKIAWAHLLEYPDYYTRLDAMEAAAEQEWVTTS